MLHWLELNWIELNWTDVDDFMHAIMSSHLLQINNWRAQFQNRINPLLMKIEFLTSLYRFTLQLVTEWNLDPDNSRKYIFFLLNFVFPYRHVYKFRQRNLFFSEVPKWICLILELNSSIVRLVSANKFQRDFVWRFLVVFVLCCFVSCSMWCPIHNVIVGKFTLR